MINFLIGLGIVLSGLFVAYLFGLAAAYIIGNNPGELDFAMILGMGGITIVVLIAIGTAVFILWFLGHSVSGGI